MIPVDVGIRAGDLGMFNAVGGIGILHPGGLVVVHFGDGAVVFPAVVGEAVVPEDVLLHEGHAVALDGVGNDDGGLAISFGGQGLAQGVMVVAVDLMDIPAEGLPFGGQGAGVQGIIAEVQALHMVVVHNGHQIVKAEVGCQLGSFPDGALVAFAVAQDYKHAMIFLVLPGCQGHTGTGGQAVAMIGSIFADLRPEQLAGGLTAFGITAVDVWVLALGTLLLFVVSLLQERGADVGAWICRRALPIRWAVLIGGVLCVLLMGIWGSGFSEAAFIYYQF